MKLNFTKTETGEVEVTILENGQNKSFSYIEMINSLISGMDIECFFSGQFDEDEKNKINNLKEEINKTIEKEKNALDV